MGEKFFDSVFADIDALALYGGIHWQHFGFHRRLATRFPFAIYYRLHAEQEVVIYRVLDCRQDPAKTKATLKPD